MFHFFLVCDFCFSFTVCFFFLSHFKFAQILVRVFCDVLMLLILVCIPVIFKMCLNPVCFSVGVFDVCYAILL